MSPVDFKTESPPSSQSNRENLSDSTGHRFGLLLRARFPVAALGVTFGALRNVFSDTVEVGRMAMAMVCAEHVPPCRAQMTHWKRSWIGQTFDIHTPSGPIVVRCQREYYFLGDYRCILRDPAPV